MINQRRVAATNPHPPVTSTTWVAVAGLSCASTLSTRAPAHCDNPILFAGYVYDAESHLYHVRNRHFHPTFGRWVQRDPSKYINGLFLYGFANLNPVRYIDTNGLWSVSIDVYYVVGISVSFSYDQGSFDFSGGGGFGMGAQVSYDPEDKPYHLPNTPAGGVTLCGLISVKAAIALAKILGLELGGEFGPCLSVGDDGIEQTGAHSEGYIGASFGPGDEDWGVGGAVKGTADLSGDYDGGPARWETDVEAKAEVSIGAVYKAGFELQVGYKAKGTITPVYD